MFDDELVPFFDDAMSDESSYYGDDEMKRAFEADLKSFDPLEYWRNRDLNFQYIRAQDHGPSATHSVKRHLIDDLIDPEPKRAKLVPDPTIEDDKENHNPTSPLLKTTPLQKPAFHKPYENLPSAKQTTESITSFLTRLRPSTTTIAEAQDPWIWVANPYATRLRAQDTATFRQLGFTLLESFQLARAHLEDTHPEKPPGSITRMLKPTRDVLEAQIADVAATHHVLTGKWMLFPRVEDVDAVWHTVARATWDGELGCSAKVAPMDTEDVKPERLICIYTKDFRDRTDVKRVLREMKRLGLVKDGVGGKALYYKCDAYTHLDLMSGNEYKIKASLYCSRDLFQEMR